MKVHEPIRRIASNPDLTEYDVMVADAEGVAYSQELILEHTPTPEQTEVVRQHFAAAVEREIHAILAAPVEPQAGTIKYPYRLLQGVCAS